MDDSHRQNPYQSIHLGRIPRRETDPQSRGGQDSAAAGAGVLKQGHEPGGEGNEKLVVALPENYLQPLEAKALVHASSKLGSPPNNHVKGNSNWHEYTAVFIRLLLKVKPYNWPCPQLRRKKITSNCHGAIVTKTYLKEN